MKRRIGISIAIRLTLVLLAASGCLAAGVESASFDYGPYERILIRYLRPGTVIDGIAVTAVDYAALADDAKSPAGDFGALLRQLAAFNPDALVRREDRMAFWINAYNIAAIKMIVDHYPVDSIRSRKINWLGLPWGIPIITVGGKAYSLGEIENDILLGTFGDLRVHFAINCASASCVNLALRPYRGETLSAQLDEQGRLFLADPNKGCRIDRAKKIVFVSQVFKFDRKHFDRYEGGVLGFIRPHLREPDRAYLEKEHVGIEYLEYDWKANDTRNAR